MTRLPVDSQFAKFFHWIGVGLVLVGLFWFVAYATAAPNEQTLTAVPNTAQPGETISLQGSGYTPGGYQGTIRWNGVDVATFEIPAGGAFTQDFAVPDTAVPGVYEVTVCAGTPCFTFEFEQLATTAVTVEGYTINLPL
ncbi:MAG: hypothetical protein KDD89_10285, partial [Anaerolineales bacterium]|nr:hypothetical protein [Anaerolineales bacterium]